MLHPQSLRVLVVDDEPLIRWSIAETLNDRGHTVVEATNACGARAAMNDDGRPIDVILLDLRLPDSGDLGLLAEFKQRLPGTAVVVMTAHGTPEITQSALSLGAHSVVGKPFDMDAVDPLVRNAYEAAHLH
jgi:DNA-binding NtrC family response regulator